MVTVWTACFSGLCTFVIKALATIHCLQDEGYCEYNAHASMWLGQRRVQPTKF